MQEDFERQTTSNQVLQLVLGKSLRCSQCIIRRNNNNAWHQQQGG